MPSTEAPPTPPRPRPRPRSLETDGDLASPAAALRSGLLRALRSGRRGVVLLTREDARALVLAEDIAETLDWPMHTWSAASGVDGSGRELELSDLLARLHGGEASERGDHRAAGVLWLLHDVGPSLRSPADERRLRELAQRPDGPALLLVEADLDRHLHRLVASGEYLVESLPLPALSDLTARARWAAAHLTQDRPSLAAALEAQAPELAAACLGVELSTFDLLLAEATSGCEAEELADFVTQRKPALLARDSLLELAAPVPAEELGGLEAYRGWLAKRRLALDPRARSAAIPAPRGVLLVGVQGCGKSLAARASADLLGLPLARLDLGRLFGGTVGESEANLRRATSALERMAPLVLWIDEIDKGLAGADGGRSDGGTAARVMGGLLTWLQERERPVFVVATANAIDNLPPELLRRGRLDELFFVDLPDPDQRAAVLRVHLELRPSRVFGVRPPLADEPEAFYALAREAHGFSGAELEAALVEARLEAFARGQALAAADLSLALEATVPLSRARPEALTQLREWAQGRARTA